MDEARYIELIRMELLGTLSKEGAEELSVWKNRSVRNLEEYGEIRRLLDVSSSYGHDIEINLDEDYQLLQDKINSSDGGVRYTRLNYLFAAAASLALLFTAWLLLRPESSAWIEVTAQSSNYSISLSDGSTVSLEEGSKLKYKEDYANSRIVHLDGVAYFDIAHDIQKEFRVISEHFTTVVLGTQFIVSDHVNNNGASINLIEGRVAVIDNNGNEFDLLPNEEIIWEKDRLKKVQGLNIAQFDWFDYKLIFDDLQLNQVAEELRKVYGIQLTLDSSIRSCPLSATFNNLEIEELLKSIALLFEAELKTEGFRQYEITEGRCQ